ncbi:unnamed protein product, partial [Brenthis ino]
MLYEDDVARSKADSNVVGLATDGTVLEDVLEDEVVAEDLDVEGDHVRNGVADRGRGGSSVAVSVTEDIVSDVDHALKF